MRRSAMLLVALATMMAMASPALANTTENPNNPRYWGHDCVKISDGFDDRPYWMSNGAYDLVVVKGGPTRVVYKNVWDGQKLWAPENPKRKVLGWYGVSHVIVCGDGYDDPYDPPGHDDPYEPPSMPDPGDKDFPNRPGSWGESCVKISDGFDDLPYWISDGDYDLVVVKGGPTRVLYKDVEAGDKLWAPVNPKRKVLGWYGVSHVIVCGDGYDDPYDPPGHDDPYEPPSMPDPGDKEYPNRPGSWGDSCIKIEDGFDDLSYWIADGDYALVVVKGGPTRVLYKNVKEGWLLRAPINPNKKNLGYYGVSHVILCGGYDDPYEPPPPPDDPYGG